jgi:hypothetical protein
MKKRMDCVEISVQRKRGGQPGNTNAQKTGRHKAIHKENWRRVRGMVRFADALVDQIEREHGLKRGRGRPRGS